MSDRKLAVEHDLLAGVVDHYEADVQSYSEYYPYGMVLRSGTDGSSYRYGFQGQEDDPELKGSGNSTNYKYRMHDPRIGRFFAVDPLAAKYPYYTPYSFSGNEVTNAVELEGLEPKRNIDQQTGNVTPDPAIDIDHNSSVGSMLAEGEPLVDEQGNYYNYHCGAVDHNGNVVGDGAYFEQDYIPFAISYGAQGHRFDADLLREVPTYNVHNDNIQFITPFGYGGLDPNSALSPWLSDYKSATRMVSGTNPAMGDLTMPVIEGILTVTSVYGVARAGARLLVRKGVYELSERSFFALRNSIGKNRPAYGSIFELGSKRLSDAQMAELSNRYGIEFAQFYTAGAGKNGAGGVYHLVSGSVNKVPVLKIADDVFLINHTHPGGSLFASKADRAVLEAMKAVGNPQRTSSIIGAGEGTGGTATFTIGR